MASISKTIYIGVTNDVYERTWQHKRGFNKNSFTDRYNCHKLVYYETFDDINEAIAREKQLKRWRREKKIKLIEKENPHWRDLSDDWYD
ncbi:GIY-YIG nuclease family protein [bacterium]|nr:GIY-YIG nuclease family protein [bacterium]